MICLLKLLINDAEINSPIDFQDEENKFDRINYPSSRLGAVTRKPNELSKALEAESKDNIIISQLLDELKNKVENFEQCCISEENRS